MENLCLTRRNPSIAEYCALRKDKIPYSSDIKPQVFDCLYFDRKKHLKSQSCYEKIGLKSADWIVISFYFVAVLIIGLLTTIKRKDSSKIRSKNFSNLVFRTKRFMNFSLEGQNLTSFLLAGRSLGFFTVATSLFSADIGAGHFIGIFGYTWLRQPQRSCELPCLAYMNITLPYKYTTKGKQFKNFSRSPLNHFW